MLDDIVFALRESPDWAGLARDHATGAAIDPSRYANPRGIPSFPKDIPGLIGRWNAMAPIGFFECRRRLKEIALGLMRRVAHAHLVAHAELPGLLAWLGRRRYLLFFCDDDDWFDPDLFSTLARLDLEGVDAAVFPLVRFEMNTFTLVPEGKSAREAVGPCYKFVLRYHTNNYALLPQVCLPERLPMLLEHRAASMAAEELGFADRYFDSVISATNKTPCSASLLADVVADAPGFRTYLGQYLHNVRQLAIPPGLGWMAPPLRETIALFEALVAGQADSS